MPPQDNSKKQGAFAAKVEQSLGVIPGTKLWSPFPFAGLNLQDSPPAIDDKEFSYLENFFRLGNGYLRTGYDVGSPIYTAGAGKTLLPYFFFYNIAEVDYVIAFFTDGTAVQVQQSNGAVTPIGANVGMFYTSGGSLPVCTQWGNKYLVISNNNFANAYWIWDGGVLFTAGGSGPEVNLTSGGEDYSSLPTVTAFNGEGSGVAVVPTIENGNVTSLKVTNSGVGYVPGDTVQLQFSGGGSDTGAILLAELKSSSVAAVDVTNGGTGYSATPTITFSAPTGSTATATAHLGGFLAQSVTSVAVTNPGAGYTTSPTVSFSGGGGTGAAAHAIVSGGQVVQINVTSGGLFYSSPPTVTIGSPSGAATATGTAVVVAGVITEIDITNPGSGYIAPPSITITDGSGINATATAIMQSGGVVSVNIVNGGSGYTLPPNVTFVGGNGVGAAALTRLTATSVQFVNVTSGGGQPGAGGYQTPPNVVFHNSGTGGSGASATSIIEDGIVVGVTVTNGGNGYTYPPFIEFTGGGLPSTVVQATAEAILQKASIGTVLVTNQGSGYTQAPAVVIAPGANNAAAALLEMMPFGINGNDIESFNSHILLSHPFQKTQIPTGGDFVVSAPGSLTDFATSDGGVLFVNSDRFLKKHYTGLRQSNGYLYVFGDSSCSVVSNINTSGNPATTTFSYQNVDPQVGMVWRDTAQDFGRTILFGNETGIFGLYGGAATKVSGKIDRLYSKAIFPPQAGAVTPSAAVATFFHVKYYFYLFTVPDAETGALRNIMACWNEREWNIASQSVPLTFIATQESSGASVSADSNLQAWGTDGTAIYPLFVQPSSTLVKRLSTKFYGTDSLLLLKDFYNVYLQAQDMSTGAVGIDMAVSMVASGIAIQPGGNPSYNSVENTQFSSANYPEALFQNPHFAAAPPFWPLWGTGSGGFSFSTLGIQFRTTSPDFAISNLLIAYGDDTAYQ